MTVLDDYSRFSFNESGYARRVAEQIGADHHERMVEAVAAVLLPQLVWHAEEPTADSSILAVYYLSQMTREHVTMALSGDGADETHRDADALWRSAPAAAPWL